MSTTSSQSSDAGKGSSAAAGDGEDKEPSLELMHALRGHTVKNWPIRCVHDSGWGIFRPIEAFEVVGLPVRKLGKRLSYFWV